MEKNAASAVSVPRVVLVLLGYQVSWKTTQPVGNRSSKEAQVSTPESHELESFFEKLTQPPPEHTAHGQGDPAEEFNALFKKLSALDELNWAPDADHPAPRQAAPARARKEQAAPSESHTADDASDETAPATETAAPAMMSPRMAAPELTQEDAPDAAPTSAAEAAQPAPAIAAPRKVRPRARRRAQTAAAVVSAEAVTSAGVPRPGKLERAGRVLKIATVSLALFGIGLGAVWAALTLPHRVNHPQPTVAERAIPSSSRTATDAKAAAPAQAVVLPATAAELQVTEVEAKPAIPAPPAPLTRAERPRAPQAPVVAAVSGVETAAAPTSAQSADAGGFALQVGACASEQCLANYRSLLTPFVAPDTIRVIAASSGEGATVQRVRIAPLDLDQARKLKVAMAADARLRNAYVITLN